MKFIWLGIFLGIVGIKAMIINLDFPNNLAFAFGWSIVWFVAGIALSLIWWGVTKKKRSTAWQWFHWLNAGAYLMAGLLIFSVFVNILFRT